jgi:hypothetical protein
MAEALNLTPLLPLVAGVAEVTPALLGKMAVRAAAEVPWAQEATPYKFAPMVLPAISIQVAMAEAAMVIQVAGVAEQDQLALQHMELI